MLRNSYFVLQKKVCRRKRWKVFVAIVMVFFLFSLYLRQETPHDHTPRSVSVGLAPVTHVFMTDTIVAHNSNLFRGDVHFNNSDTRVNDIGLVRNNTFNRKNQLMSNSRTNTTVNGTLDMTFEGHHSPQNKIILNNGTVTLYMKYLLQYIGEEGVRELLARQLSASKKNDKTFDGRQYPLKVDVRSLWSKKADKGVLNVPAVNDPFKIVLNPRHKCDVNTTSVMIVFVVKTSPGNTEKRNMIRRTWGDENRFREIRTVFSLGIPSDKRTIQNIHKEWDEHKDILFVDYKDTYYNLTLKTISGINWSVEYCGNAKYVISVDDDMYVATDYIMSYLNNLPINITERLFSGHEFHHSSPLRTEDNVDEYYAKYIVSYDEYKWNTYPSYIFGGFIIMSQRTAKEFQFAIRYTEVFKFEDVYLGILANRLGIKTTHIQFVDNIKTPMNSLNFKTLIASHFYNSPQELQTAWQCHLSLIGQFKEANSEICAGHRGLFIRKEQIETINTGIKSFVSWIKKKKT